MRVGGLRAKPSTQIAAGSRIEVHGSRRDRIVVVEQLLVKRVGAALAVEAYQDHSPPIPTKANPLEQRFAVRDRGSGRPTKAERRQLDKLRGRSST